MKKSIAIVIILILSSSMVSFGQSDHITKLTCHSSGLTDLFHPSDQDLFLINSTSTHHINNSQDQILRLKDTIHTPLSEVRIQMMAQNLTTIQLSQGTVFNQPDLPLLPMKTLVYSLPEQAVVNSISFENYTIKQCMKSMSFHHAPLPSFWSVNTTPLHNHTLEIIQQTKARYAKHTLYPGYTHTSIIGRNATNTTVIIHFFPIQYNNQTKETFLLTKSTLTIEYQMSFSPKIDPLVQEDAVENIIITPLKFLRQAEKLKQFHESRGTSTEVVSTTWINTHFMPSDYPSMMGYKDFTFQQRIPKYDDTLARKIISYLHSQQDNPSLQFITILGNAKQVPPSYYFGESYYPVPTDFYYSSPDLDLIPNYCVGRLPAHTLLEASEVVQKIINWNPTGGQMDQVAIAGGIPFQSPFYIGELITIDSVNQGYFNGLDITKYFRSDERFDKDDVLSGLQEPFGLFHMICHGSPFLIAVEEGRIDAKDIGKMTRNSNAPILTCIGCSSGSFDTYVIKQGIRMAKTGFGESIVLSKGGGIAFVGGSRTNDGYPLFTLNKGRVEITKETYLAGLLSYVNQGYSQNLGYLGELTKYAAETYLMDNDMSDFWNLYHYFSFVLLGDPALALPMRSHPQPIYQQPQSSSMNQLGYFQYESSSDDYQGPIPLLVIEEKTEYACLSEASIINVKYLETGMYRSIQGAVNQFLTIDNITIFDLNPVAGELMLLRFEAEDGKEDWTYFKPVRPVDDEYNHSTPGFMHTRWNRIQDAVNHADISDPIYVFNGTYYEQIIIDKPIRISGEHQSESIIDGLGYGDVVSIFSDGVILSDVTIEHCGRNPENAGIFIRPRKTMNPEPITIQRSKIQNNLNCGIFIDSSHRMMSPSINLFGNEISYNNHGVYVKSGMQDISLYTNHIYGNNQGITMVDSQNDDLIWNIIENNGVGLVFHEVKNIDVIRNGFIDNGQHCQFIQTRATTFDENYWDDWIGLNFNRDVRIPKIINGIYDKEQPLLPQIKIDRHPQRFVMQNMDFLKNYL